MSKNPKYNFVIFQRGAKIPGPFPAADIPHGYRHPHDQMEMYAFICFNFCLQHSVIEKRKQWFNEMPRHVKTHFK